MSHHTGNNRPSKRRRLSPPNSDVESSNLKIDEDTELERQDRGTSDQEDSDNELDARAGTEDGGYAGEEEEDIDEEQEDVDEEEEDVDEEDLGEQPHSNGDSDLLKEEADAMYKTRSKLQAQSRAKVGPAAQTPRKLNGTSTPATGTSMFRMQVEELLKQVKPSYDETSQAIGDYLAKLKAAIEAIPDRNPLPLQEAEKKLLKSHKIAIPFSQPRPATDVKYKFGYARPTSINVVGSYALRTATKDGTGMTVDLILHIPTPLFEFKDYLNYRYFHKRAYYLACVAAGLNGDQTFAASMKFTLMHDNPLHPVLLLEKNDEQPEDILATADFKIRIIPAIPESLFPIAKTLSDCNCVRTVSAASGENEAKLPPTPFYNASLRVDSSVNGHLKLLHSATARCEGFRDACILGRTWLKQRGLSSSVAEGGIGHFEWASLMALLLETGGPKEGSVLSPSYNSVQMFGATLHFLAHRDLVKSPLTMGSRQVKSEGGRPVIFDGERGVNVLYKMTRSSYQQLRMEAQASSRLFGGGSPERFESLFIMKVAEPLLQYDIIFHVPAADRSNKLLEDRRNDLYDIAARGLGDRATSIVVSTSKTSAWPINTSRSMQKMSLTLSIVLDPANAATSVDRGPSAEDTDGTVSFRDFWGGRAELRRFKDGEIRESLVWSTNDPIAVTKEIMMYVIERHLGSKVAQGCKAVDTDLKLSASVPKATASQTTYETAMVAYRMLESAIRGLEGLPLSIRQIQPTGVKLRNTAFSQQENSAPADMTVQFEGSSRWPDDLTAIQMTKIAFLLKLQSLLTGHSSITSARLGLENSTSDIQNTSFLNVTLQSHTFRIRIHHDREATLLGQRLSSRSLSPADRTSTAFALAEHRRVFLRAPPHTSALQKLSTAFPAYPPTVRLVKTWFASHLLGNHFRPEAVELLTLKVFLQPTPYPVPSSATTGLLRTLAILARWDWLHDPLILDFSSSSPSSKTPESSAIQTNFTAWRHIDPITNRLALFIATNLDPDGSTWTEHTPSKVAAARMSSLARAAVAHIHTRGTELSLPSLFMSSLNDYDFVLRLAVPKATGEGKVRYKNLRAVEDGDAGFVPQAGFLAELERVYGDAAVFFADTGIWGVIGGVWSPGVARRRWKVNLGWSSVPVSGDDGGGGTGADIGDARVDVDVDVQANKEAMLAEMERLGGDLVRSVERR